MLTNLVCPVSADRVDSNTSRLTVFFNAALMIAFMFTLQPVVLYIVTIDYAIRAAGYNQFSPLCFLSSAIIKIIGSKPKVVDKAPKMFASRLGFICAALGVIFISLDMVIPSMGIIGFFIVLALLDSVFNFCVGCIIYNYLVFPFFKNKMA
ncbi:MAG: DUF4395 domain-containing protein [Bacteroidia bacterium]